MFILFYQSCHSVITNLELQIQFGLAPWHPSWLYHADFIWSFFTHCHCRRHCHPTALLIPIICIFNYSYIHTHTVVQVPTLRLYSLCFLLWFLTTVLLVCFETQAAAMATSDVKLLSTWSCPFALRVRIALNIESINYELLEENLGSKSQLLLQFNPV